MSGIIKVLLGVAVLQAFCPAIADDVECPPTIRFVAEDEPLDAAIRRLAAEQDFRANLNVSLTEPVTGSFIGSPGDVLRELLRGKNAIIEEAPTHGCENPSRVTRVWLLGSGEAVARIEASDEMPRVEAVAAPAPQEVARDPNRAHRGKAGMTAAEKDAYKLARKGLDKASREKMDAALEKEGAQ